jgi:transcriptional regulator with XRE-family HTH domain
VRPASSPADGARTALGRRLREIREDAGLTGRALADLAGWPRTKVSKIEHGNQAPTVKDIEAWCRHTGTEDQQADLIASMRAVTGQWIEWRRAVRAKGLRGVQDSYVALWERTRQFRIYEASILPGLIQTEDYARAVLGAFANVQSIPTGIEAAVVGRMERQRILTEGDHTFAVVLEHEALDVRFGSADVMAGQLGRLISVATSPRVSLGIIPRGVERTVTANPGFWIYDDDRVILETPSAQLTVEQPREIEVFARTFAALSSLAVHGQAARLLIADSIKALGQ